MKNCGYPFFMVALLSACSTLPSLSSPDTCDQHIEATQMLTLHHGEETQEAIVLLDIAPNDMKVAATTPQGQTLLKATVDASGQLHGEIPAWLKAHGIDAQAIVRDIQIALWPAEALRAHGWEITDSADENIRRVNLNGSPWAMIRYEGNRLQPTHIEITRTDNLYSVELHTIEWTRL